MAAVLQFRRKSAPATWVNEELAEFYRIVDVMGRAGLAITVDVGASDEGEPWVAFIREDTGDVLAHIARIDGWVIAVSAASPEVVRAQSLKEVVRRIVDTHPLVLLPSHRPGAHVHVHPCAVLAAFITAAYLLAEGVQSEAHAREYAANVAADAAAVTHVSIKPAPHPNALRSALTSITDFLRGVGDLAQPVSLNAQSASAAIAAVVAFVFSGDDNGGTSTQRIELVAARHEAEAVLNAAAQIADQASKLAEQKGAQSVLGLTTEKDQAERDSGVEMSIVRHVLADVDTTARSTDVVQPQGRDNQAAAAPNDGVPAHLPTAPAETAERAHMDAAMLTRLAAVELQGEHAAKPASSETISSALSTVANAVAPKADASAVASGAITTSTTKSAPDVTDHPTTSAAHSSTQSGDYLVVRLADLSKAAIDALRLTDMSQHAGALEASSGNAVTSVQPQQASAQSGGLASVLSAVSMSVLDLAPSVKTDPVVSSLTSEQPTSSAASGTKTDSVTDSLLKASAPGTTSVATASTPSTDSAPGPSAHQIISSIVDFAFGTDLILSTSAAMRAGIVSDLVAHGVVNSGQKVLVFSSDSVKVTTFEFTPGIVMMERSEIAIASGNASLLPPAAAGKVIDLADGAAIRLVGVIDLSATV